VYGEADALPRDVGLVPIRLTYNLRNTQRIHKAAAHYYAGYRTDPVGPEGVEVEWHEVASDGLPRAIHREIQHCVRNDRIRPDDIAVLVGREQEIDALVTDNTIGGCGVARCTAPAEGTVTIDTIRRFKGLERQVVLVVVDGRWIRDVELLYVAFSRARVRLIIIGAPEYLKHLRDDQ
jgi:hypothetical protein